MNNKKKNAVNVILNEAQNRLYESWFLKFKHSKLVCAYIPIIIKYEKFNLNWNEIVFIKIIKPYKKKNINENNCEFSLNHIEFEYKYLLEDKYLRNETCYIIEYYIYIFFKVHV